MVAVQVIAGCAPALCSRLVCSGVLLGRVFFLLGFSSAGGVRPAAHLSLNSLASAAGYTISASLASAATDRAQLDKYSDTYSTALARPVSFTYTATTGNYISSVDINGTNVIPNENSNDYVQSTGFQYKCYRVANRVVVTIYNATTAVNIVGHAAVSRINVISYDPTMTLQTGSMYSWASATEYYTQIVAEFTISDKVRLNIDGAWADLVGDSNTGTVMVNGREATYTHSIYEHYITITVRGLSLTNHTITLEHYTGSGAAISANFSTNNGTITLAQGENGVQRLIVRPADDEFVYSMTIDGVSVPIQYYTAYVYGAGCASSIRYVASDSTNTFILEVTGLCEPMTVTFATLNSKPTYAVPPTSSGGFGVSGTYATASTGGEVRMVGNDIANGADDDTVTFIAVAYTGYRFVGWVYADDESEIIDDAASIKFTKEQVNGKVIKAVFEPINNTSINDNLDNDFDTFV